MSRLQIMFHQKRNIVKIKKTSYEMERKVFYKQQKCVDMATKLFIFLATLSELMWYFKIIHGYVFAAIFIILAVGFVLSYILSLPKDIENYLSPVSE